MRELVTEAGAQAERAGQLERAAGAAAARLPPFAERLARASALHANLQDRCGLGCRPRTRTTRACPALPALPKRAAALRALTARPAAASPGSAHARASRGARRPCPNAEIHDVFCVRMLRMRARVTARMSACGASAGHAGRRRGRPPPPRAALTAGARPRVRLLAELHWALPHPLSAAEAALRDARLPALEADAAALRRDLDAARRAAAPAAAGADGAERATPPARGGLAVVPSGSSSWNALPGGQPGGGGSPAASADSGGSQGGGGGAVPPAQMRRVRVALGDLAALTAASQATLARLEAALSAGAGG